MANLEKKRNEWLLKSDKDVKKMLDQIRTERIKKELDTDLIPYGELISASFRYEPLIDILKSAKIKRRHIR